MSLLIGLIALVAALLSAMSGAGSGMITVPAWILLGFPLPVGIAANNVSGALWTPIAARNYLVSHKLDWKLIGGMVVCGLFGAYGGTQVILQVDEALLRRIFGFVILVVVFLTYVNQDFGISAGEFKFNRLITALFALPLGFYETFFGSGNGMFTSAMLIKTRGFVLTTALGYYYVVAFSWCCLGTYVYLHEGVGNWSLIIPSSIGGMCGAYIGSLIGRKRGPRFIRKAFLLLGGILGLRLAIGY